MSGSEQPGEIDVEARVREYYAYLDRLAAQLPDEWIEEGRERLVNAILADLAREPWPERARRWIVELLTERPLALTGLVTATLAAVVCAVLQHEPAGHRTEAAVPALDEPAVAPEAVAMAEEAPAKPDMPEASPATVAASPAEAHVPAHPAPAPAADNLASLRTEFERLKAGDAGVDRAYLIRLVDHIVAREDRESATFAGLCLLLVETYEQMGERDRALAAYGRYLDIIEAREGASQASHHALIRALDYFDRGDYHAAIAHGDLILTRYPESPQAAEADYMTGRYLERLGQLEEAIAHYRQVAARDGQGRVAHRISRRMPELIYNARRADEAYLAARAHAAADPSAEGRAGMHILLGMMMEARGEYAGALREFQSVVREYPGSQYAQAAGEMVARITSQVLGADFLN